MIGKVIAATSLAVVILSLHGCGGGSGTECDKHDLSCRCQKDCNAKCNDFNITTAEEAKDCAECMSTTCISDALELCPNKTVDSCVGCVTETSVTCWANPVQLLACNIKCVPPAVWQDPLGCPRCWVQDYVGGCIKKYSSCFNNTLALDAVTSDTEKVVV
eukprot:TRINITY_DN9147_c0_g1_i2.p1 TRINITY_DN9147_c0_g1~~TRINITY_DN9147_c0_g1_i2.p1  ORF type:complete len:183 (-),score=40.94 TRINITY_DN9147_c0_g1_i2:202-681(-)